jgi:hypothetical protein
METPNGDNFIGSVQTMLGQGVSIPPVESLPLSKYSIFTPFLFTSWEPATHLFSDQIFFVPSDMIWIKERMKVAEFLLFQSSSNGGAFAQSEEDALITALYELIERDAWTLYETVLASVGKYPVRVSLEDAPDPIADAVDRIRVSGSEVFLFDITSDIGVRAFAAYLFDKRDINVGVFGGFGCSADPLEAALRAIMESAQSRCCYLDGARDDLARRNFYLLKHIDAAEHIKLLEELPFGASISAYLPIRFDTPEDELNWIKGRLIERGMRNVYWKVIWDGELGGQPFCVVKAFSLDLEQIRGPLWVPTQRVIDRVKKELPSESRPTNNSREDTED